VLGKRVAKIKDRWEVHRISLRKALRDVVRSDDSVEKEPGLLTLKHPRAYGRPL